MILYLILFLINPQEICDKVVSEDCFMLKYCLDRSKTQETCDKAVDAFLPTLTIFLDWIVTKIMIQKPGDVVLSNDDAVFVNKDFDKVTFFSDEVGILNVDLKNINLHDVNFD